jgi:DNA polymerase I-like protein with 3'-5' exonuclease and polymerase domains
MTATQVTTPPMEYHVVRDAQALQRALSPLVEASVLGIDTETTGLDPFQDQLCLVQLAAPGHVPVISDLRTILGEGRASLRAVLAGQAIKVFHNGKFDLKILLQNGLPVQGLFFDTMLAEQLLTAGLQRTSRGITWAKRSRRRSRPAIGAASSPQPNWPMRPAMPPRYCAYGRCSSLCSRLPS